ncbi:MAG TPA: NADH:flavin oxidoreductase [Stellaceae bacterium]|nr:NADH:flavin oxidoreductase [Stellaceae bacterium]
MAVEQSRVEPPSFPARDPLLQPFQIKHLTLKNRVMSTSHAAGLEEGGMPAERYQLYHEGKARGGIALTMFGGSSNVAPDSPNIFRQLNVGVDEIIPHLQQFSRRIHAHGAALMCQITHLGRRGEPYASNWLPTISPSPIRETLHRSFPKEMDEDDIDRVTKSFGAAALRCKEGGLDGIETLAGGHLIGQFLSPKTNHRTDRYGGTLANRCRFGLMVFEEIRRRTGADFLVGFRYVVDEGDTPGDMGFEECVEIAHVFERTGLIDFFNAIYGRMDTEIALAVDNMPGMASPIAPWLKRVGQFKKEVKLPVFHAARIADIATARYAIREGLLDMVAMTRAHIADPYIVAKLQAGKEELIRPCVGATHCQSQYRPHCLHNPSTGREGVLPQVIERSDKPGRRIVVVGGGPAGLEAARVCAERGHRVVLFEASDKLGGQVLLAARASWRKDIIGIIDWRRQELQRLGVEVRLNAFVERADVVAEHPDVAIIATGGTPDIEWLPGADLCTSVWDAIGGAPLANDVLIYDGTGRHPAPQAAELAAGQGRRVQVVSIDGQLAQELTYAERAIWKRRAYELKLPMTFDHEIEKVERRGNRLLATFRNLMTRGTIELAADQVIIERGTAPADQLYRDLRQDSANNGVTDLEALLNGRSQPFTGEREFELHRIGDAVASRNIAAAILDAIRLCFVM